MSGEAGVRRRMSAEDRREQILDVTHAIVDAEGFHAATPNRIAEAAGVTRPVLYQQFGDLPSLFVALIDREIGCAALQLAQAIAEGGDAEDADPFVSTFAGALRAVDAHPMTWRLFLFPPEGAPPELHQRHAESTEYVQAFLEAELRTAFPRLPDPEYTARIIHAAGRELLQRRLTEPERATFDRLVALIRHLRMNVLPADATSDPGREERVTERD